MTGVTLNFAYIPLQVTWSLSSSLEESSTWGISSSGYISSTGHRSWIHFFTSCDSPPCSSSRGVHCVWVGKLLSQHPSLWLWFRGASFSMCLQPCFHVHVCLLPINGHLLPLLIGVWLIEFEYLLVQPYGQPFCEGLNCLGYVEPIFGHSDCFFKFGYVGVDVFSFHLDPIL